MWIRGEKMHYTKRGLGKFYVESYLQDGEGIRILKNFLLGSIIEIANESKRFINQVGQSPFAYSERQLHTVIAPAISRTSDCFIMESPVDRKWSQIDGQVAEDSRGWVDYWCCYKQFNYYIELKKRYVSYSSKTLTQQVKEEWQVACNQLDVIQEDIKEQEKIAKRVFRIAIEVLTIYGQSKDKEKLTYNLEGLLEVQKNTMAQLSEIKPPNWSCLWVLHDHLVEKYTYGDTMESYPAILFLAHIE